MGFPKDFIWGAASAAYQVEGAVNEDGRTPTIWDIFSHTEGKTFGGHTGDTACDHYHRCAEDIGLIAGMGVRHYRFGIGWSRVLPEGSGKVNQRGLSFYDRLVDTCLEHGVLPHITMYHWDLPQILEERGGWRNRDTARAFAELCGVAAEHFKGRVQNYFTLNEPQCAASLGYGSGLHAPGKALELKELFRVFHNMGLAHGLGMKALRGVDSSLNVGLVSTGRLCYPSTGEHDDYDAARNASFRLTDDDWAFTHNALLDPAIFGRYPIEDTREGELRGLFEAVSPDDLRTINQRPDFIGLNIYNGSEVTHGGEGEPVFVPRYEGYPRTALKWPVTPEVLRYGPRLIFERYGLPIVITENGQSCNDRIFLDGKVHDADRIDFLKRYLSQLKLAIEDGVRVQGYFHWSLTDNFEWHSGYDDRFGLVYIDYRTQKRIPKDSYRWYSETVRMNGENLGAG